MQKLLLIGGFPSVADKVSHGGMEEVGATIAAGKVLERSASHAVVVEYDRGTIWLAMRDGPRLVRHNCEVKSEGHRERELLHLISESEPQGFDCE
jgi:hypothetical protein